MADALSVGSWFLQLTVNVLFGYDWAMPVVYLYILGDMSAEDLFRMFFGGHVFTASKCICSYKLCKHLFILTPPLYMLVDGTETVQVTPLGEL